jgi:hypothetical protein
MRRRSTLPLVLASLTLSALGLASCDAPQRAVAQRVAPNGRASADIAVGDTYDPLRSLVQQLYSGINKDGDAALAYYDAARAGARTGDACTPTADLLALTFDAYRAGGLAVQPGDDKGAANVQPHRGAVELPARRAVA